MKNRFNLDFLPILAAGIFWGTMSPAGKQLAILNTDMLSVAFLRTVLMSSAVGIYIFLRKKELFRITTRQCLFLVLLSGITIGGIYAGYFFSLKHLSVSLTVVIFFSHPLITALGSAIITGEPPTRFQIAGAILTIAGVSTAALSSFSGPGGSFDLHGIIWCLFAALAMSVYSISGRLSAKTGFVNQTALFFYIQFFGIFWMAFIKTLASGWADIPTLQWEQLKWILHISLIGSLIGYSLYFIGLRRVNATTASIVSCIEIVTAMSLSALFLAQPPIITEVIGGILIIMAICIVSSEKSLKKVSPCSD